MTNTKMFYKGKRLVGKVMKHTCTDGETQWHYPKAKDYMFYGAEIGREYETNSENHKLPKLWHEAFTGNISDKSEIWQIQQRADLQKKKEINKEPSPELIQHVEAIRLALQSCSRNDRTRFITYLIETLMSWRL